MRPGQWQESVLWFFSVLLDCKLGNWKGLGHVKNHLSEKVLFQNRWRETTNGGLTNPVSAGKKQPLT